MKSLIVITVTSFLLFWFSHTSVNCFGIWNRDGRGGGGGDLPGPLVHIGGPVNSPFFDDEEDSPGPELLPFDALIRDLLKPPAPLWDVKDDDDEMVPLFGGKDDRFPFGESNPFGAGLFGNPSRPKMGPSFFEQMFKPITGLSTKDTKPNILGSSSDSKHQVKEEKVVPPKAQPTVAEMIAKNNLTWKDFIPQLKEIKIPGLELTVNLEPAVQQEQKPKQELTPEETQKSAKVNETIAQLNTVLKTIFSPQANATKVELNVGKEGGKTSINMFTDGLKGKSDDESFINRIAERLSSIFKGKNGSENSSKPLEPSRPLVEPTSKVEENEPKENALVRFFYFISRRSSPEVANVISQNVSQSLTAESKDLPNSNDKVVANLVTLVLSVVTSTLLLFNLK